MMRASLVLLILAGCAELQRPNMVEAPPPGLLAVSADPVRTALAATTQAFADQGSQLRGRPSEAARAAAQLEYLIAVAPGAVPLSRAAEIALLAARGERRAALGVPEAAAARPVVASLNMAAGALGRGDAASATRALAPVGGGETLRRLGDIGALPNAEQATILLSRELARNAAELRANPAQDFGDQRSDVLTEGLGRGF